MDLSPSTQLAERVREGVVQTLEGERDAALYYLLARHPGRALVSRTDYKTTDVHTVLETTNRIHGYQCISKFKAHRGPGPSLLKPG